MEGLRSLRTIRKRKKLTQQQLAEMCGVTQGSVCQWEQGAVLPRLKTLFRVADVLGCKVDDLWK